MMDIDLIESRYNDILHTKMEGVAVLNHKLQVKALGFQPFAEELLGVLITPWFMNLMLLPDESTEWTESDVGRKLMRTLPSGSYEFILGWDEILGGYGMCALFSPMFDFVDQEAAVATANEVIKALFETENFAPTDRQREQLKQRLANAEASTDKASVSEVDTEMSASSDQSRDKERAVRLSRRQFLQGQISGKGSVDHG